MKGIILSGGKGTRLDPITLVNSKQLIPVFDKPMIYYPLSSLISLGIDEILLITWQSMIPIYKKLLNTGSHLGLNISYAAQQNPRGIAEALIIGEEFIGSDDVALILGDNIFISDVFSSNLVESFNHGATIFSVEVNDPQRYGVVKIQGKDIIDIIEKPKDFISNQAVTGLYFYNNACVSMAKSLEPSSRGEIEITDLNKMYLNKSQLNCINLGHNATWMDAGTFDSLLDASNLIHSLQERHGRLFGCPEITALQNKMIGPDQIRRELKAKPQNGYYNKILDYISENF